MNYIDAIYEKNTVKVVERTDDGRRVYVEYPADYTFYYESPNGKFTSVYGTPLTRVVCKNNTEFKKEVAICRRNRTRTFETDIRQINRCLEAYYLDKPLPKLHTAFFDIETDFDEEKGMSPPDDPFNPITAITVYLDWLDALITVAVPPKTLTLEEAKLEIDSFENTYLFDNEFDMIDAFLDIIEDADILSGWNSTGYDIPYIVNRIIRISDKSYTKKLCLWNKEPKSRTYDRYGKEQTTYDLIGRVHLDYMDLYIKFTYHEMHSYSLDAICEYELDERKVAYTGTLDELYNADFKKFIDYNRQDVVLLAKLDRQLKFIGLANEISHSNTVQISKALGSVAVVEQGIINEAHKKGIIIQDRKETDDDESKVAGAFVVNPKKGMHKWIGSIDLNSLYPSIIRALNMSPETIIGQLEQSETNRLIESRMAKSKTISFAQAWDGLFGSVEYEKLMTRDPTERLTVEWENGKPTSHTAKELWNDIFTNKSVCISANGTIFDYSKKGIIPDVLEIWYAKRKKLQKISKNMDRLLSGIEVNHADFTPTNNGNLENVNLDALAELSGNELLAYLEEHGLKIVSNKILPVDENHCRYLRDFYETKQLAAKVLLNSTYGSLLNPGCRFFDKRLGQSTTLTGRQIAKHMDSKVNEIFTGEYDYNGKCIVYGDTDSSYFSAYPVLQKQIESGEIEWDKETVIKLYDEIAEMVNESFPDFMKSAFNSPRQYGDIIKCGREVVGTSGLFIKKKRYAIMVYDQEGSRKDINGKPGKVKAMGLDLKRADTPKVVQDFLMDILTDVLDGAQRENIVEKIIEFKNQFNDAEPWKKGTPKRVNKLTTFTDMHNSGKKGMIPGHVRAAINWNTLCDINNDKYSPKIIDGMKVIVCKLRNNPIGFTSIAYPIDAATLPNWFKELPFDESTMSTANITQKVENLLGVLKWELQNDTNVNSRFNDLFSFE